MAGMGCTPPPPMSMEDVEAIRASWRAATVRDADFSHPPKLPIGFSSTILGHTCAYCDQTPLRCDSRGRCRNCGASNPVEQDQNLNQAGPPTLNPGTR